MLIDYCKIFGYIGKLFHNHDLPSLVQFYLMFYNDKPVDWLLDDFLKTKVCRSDKQPQDCKTQLVSLKS